LDVQDQLGTRLARLSMDVQYDGRTGNRNWDVGTETGT
jgi:hypothetical protein